MSGIATWPTRTVEAAFGYSPLEASPTWRDITSYVRFRDGIDTQRGKRREDDQAQPGSMRLVLNNRSRTFDPEHTGSPWYATYLNLTGASGSYASTPDAAGLEISGDLGIVVLWEAPASFTPSPPVTLVSHYDTTGNQRSADFFLNSSGFLAFTYSTDGAVGVTKTCSALLSTVTSPGSKLWVGMTHDVNNGAAGNDVKFWYAPYASLTLDTSTLVQLGSTQTTAGTVTRFNSTAPWVVGARGNNTQLTTAKVYQATVHDNLTWSSPKMSPDFSIGLGAGVTSVTDSQSNVWTVSSPATVAADTATGSYVTPRTPIRLRATYSAVTYDVWRGHVADWQPGYNQNFDAVVTCACQDLMTIMAGVDTGGGAWRSTIESLSPLAWWRLGETSITTNVTTAADQTGRYNGTYSGGTPTATTSLINGDTNGAFSVGASGAVLLPVSAPNAAGYNASFVLWFTAPTVSGSDFTLVSFGTAITNGMQFIVKGSGGNAGKVAGEFYQAADHTLTSEVTGGSRVDDSARHCLVYTTSLSASGITTGTIYVDGASIGSTSTFVDYTPLDGGVGMWLGIRGDAGLTATNCVIDEYAIFSKTLTTTQITDLYNAGYSSWAGETTGTRIARTATIAGIPSGLQDVDTGSSTVEAWTGGTNTLAAAQAAEQTEQGLLCVSDGGQLYFVQRSALLNLTSSVTITASMFVDYESDYSESWITNDATFTSGAGSGSASNSTSIARYGRKSESRTTTDYVQGNLTAGAQWLVGRYKNPKQRVTRLIIKPDGNQATLYPQVLGREIGDRITFTRTPMNTGSAISQDLIIVGIEHTLAESGWVTSWNLSQADTKPYFQVGHATRGKVGRNYIRF